MLSRTDVCRWLPDFLAVVEAGSVKDAARALQKGAASVERSLSQLEREVGAPLFVRPRGGRLALTPVGALLLDGMGERLRELAGATVPESSRPPPSSAPPKALTWVEEEAERRRRARQWPQWVSAT